MSPSLTSRPAPKAPTSRPHPNRSQHVRARTRPEAARRLDELAHCRPDDPGQLHRFVAVVLGLDVPRSTRPGSGFDPPFEYLVHSFWEGQWLGRDAPADAVVWANRGGGKTLLGAVATLLDLLFKPGIEVRVLGGSLEQSEKMLGHLLALLDRPAVRGLTARPPTQRRITLANGSVVELLAQSHRSVRGTRVHKLRCDEVDEFRPDVWEAAQLTTRSGWCGPVYVRGAVEALSTMHRPFGLMSRLAERSAPGPTPDPEPDAHAHAHAPVPASARLIRWNYLDVIAPCPPHRDCDTCVLLPDCQRQAKSARGFVAVDDLVAQWHRTSTDTWAAEMSCHRPRRSDSVYPNFSVERHVRHREIPPAAAHPLTPVGGMDFGLRCPFVLLWAVLLDPIDPARNQPPPAGRFTVDRSPPGRASAPGSTPLAHSPEVHRHLYVFAEYIEAGLTLDQHLHAISDLARAQGTHCPPPLDRLAWIGVDPAGHQRNAHSGLSDVQVLKAAGCRVRARASRLREGIERIRRRLDRQTLSIHPRCRKLIEALSTYHFDPKRPDADEPVKDGPDHACDALRYLIINLEAGNAALQRRSYL